MKNENKKGEKGGKKKKKTFGAEALTESRIETSSIQYGAAATSWYRMRQHPSPPAGTTTAPCF
eukprot:2599129-Rhodomonas_salina.2